MVYSSRLRHAIGDVRAMLESNGLGRQSELFSRHGVHEPSVGAPLVLVACSGGRDSLALAVVSRTVCAALGLRCGAVIVDHGLQDDSATVACETRSRCLDAGLDPVAVRAVHVPPSSRGTEAAARDARYSAIIDEAKSRRARAVLLAHTRNDQAESVLIDVMRSSGLDAMAGMPRSFVRGGVLFLRPFLDLTRDQTTGICRDLGLEWWDDPTNGDSIRSDEPLPVQYPLRSRVRHDLMPYLRRFTGEDIVSHLAQGARIASLDKAYLDARCDEVSRRAVRLVSAQGSPGPDRCGESGGGGSAETPDGPVGASDSCGGGCDGSGTGAGGVELRVGELENVHPAIRLRVIAHVLSSIGLPVTSRHVEAIDALIADWHGQGAVSLPSGYSALRQKHVIRLCQDGLHANR
ncbi:MAG: tRNA lysidine(34) synthetase TilS [Bifidobacterium sp.]|jgi:tRNA(Ile)-lysidine synthase|nr:tRNA lysidine(34) synthetase TilS [Bifidobacterium sp.]MCI1864663.1 tRNA lysidine(34) synthetase TilS [Bifidobacterium sp.]